MSNSNLRALCGASAIALEIALPVPFHAAYAENNETSLPPVTVQAPPQAVPKRAAKKPAQRVATRRTPPRPVAPPPASSETPIVPTNIDGGGVQASYGAPPIKQRYSLPQESYSITSKQIDETINLKDPEDAVKYMPSLFVRKRNDGDNMAVLATRTWGLNSSARTLIYYDDLLVSALIGNNNTTASPHWNSGFPRGDPAHRLFKRAIRGRLSR